MATVTSLNAVDYGMTPNTGTNQTTNFQNAINAAQSQNLPLFVPAGAYEITTVNITAPVEIYSTQRDAQILGYGQSPQINISTGSYINYVKISDLTIDGQNQGFSGSPSDAGLIQATNVGTLIIENCNVNNSAIHGIYLNGLTGQAQVIGNTIGSAATFGIFLYNATALIQNNFVTGSGNGGIVIHRSSESGNNSIVTGNVVAQTSANSGGDGQWGNAIFVYLCDLVTVANNQIYETAFSAIRFNQSSFAQILGNTCYSGGDTAIFVEAPGEGASFNGGVISNNIIDTAGGGIIVTNPPGHRVVVSGNQVSNVTVNEPGSGYYSDSAGIFAESDVLVVGNQLDTIAAWAIVLVPFEIGSTICIGQAENNMIKNCAGGIGFVQGNANTAFFIGGNTIYNYTDTSQFAAIVDCTYNGITGVVTRVSGSTDLGNSTSSGFSNVVLLLNYSFN
jgi:uncharacterized secreted repeat protein (TIGR03808 family)